MCAMVAGSGACALLIPRCLLPGRFHPHGWGTRPSMSDEEDRKPLTEREDPGPTGDGIETEPRGNPESDDEVVEQGIEQLDKI